MRSREVRLARRPRGRAVPGDFDLAEIDVEDTPPPGHLVVRNRWMSVDPYMRGRMDDADSYIPAFDLGRPLVGTAVGEVVAGEVVAGEHPAAAIGSIVRHDLGWREVATVPASDLEVIDTGVVPAEHFLGTFGLPGLTAYVGLTRIAPVRAGDVVLISAAAGAVGLSAGAVARASGASRVIGIAGGPDKACRLTDEFGFDAGLDRRTGDLAGQIAAAAPRGVDVYFDSVGGDHLAAALATSRSGARFALCGAIGGYDTPEPPAGPDNLMLAVKREVTLSGFLVDSHRHVQPEFLDRATSWWKAGTWPDAITERRGIENAVDAFLGLLAGDNVGKMLVRL